MRTRVPLWLVIGALLAGVFPGAARAQDPAGAYFAFLAARRLEAAGDEDGALRALGRAAAADPSSAEVRAEMAEFHLRHEDRQAAEREALAALELDVDNVGANRVLGMIHTAALDDLRGRNAPEQAAEHLRQAILHLERAVAGAGDAGDILLHFTLGQLYIRNSEPRKAIEMLEHVLSANPFSAQGRIALAQAYARAGDLDGAIRTLGDVVDRLPAVARVLLGQYQELAGRFADAAETYTLALALQPRDGDVKRRRIIALIGAMDYEQAAAFAADGLREHPNDRRFLHLQGQALFDGGRRSAAFALLEQAVRNEPGDVDTMFALADLYHDAGRETDAEEALRRVVAVQPEHPNALNYLGYLLALRGENLDEAIDLVQRALEQDPENGAYLDSLGWAYFKRGDLEEAERYLTAAAERLPENSEVQDHLGDLFARAGRYAEAIAAWTRALEGDRQDVEAAAIERKISDARTRVQDAR
jgi:tetratricopeptide (TPR) repeat protein